MVKNYRCTSQQRTEPPLLSLRRPWPFDICAKMLRLFYESLVESAFFFSLAAACRWAVGGGAVDSNRLSELIRKASDGVGAEPDGC